MQREKEQIMRAGEGSVRASTDSPTAPTSSLVREWADIIRSQSVHFSSKSDNWSTPQDFFAALHSEFYFTVDAAATRDNTKCPVWFGPGSAMPDALELVEWGRPYTPCAVWLNPPYSKVAKFVQKAAEQAQHGNTVVMLIPARPDTRYWAAHIWDHEQHKPRPGVEVRFIKGRLKFGGSKNSAPFPSAVVIFRPVAA